MGTLLKIILFAVLFYYIFKGIFRFLFPFLLSNQAKKMQRKQEEAQRDYFNKQKHEEGKVTIEYDSSQKQSNKKNHGNTGEYVDYEEVK
ncbi:DUF4834 family protein [Marinilabilia rubra]|uniref:DUF4834 domain-containing protein n=1 Tax=Marinilabilia rubra TaxID=2162893 RepID=A0A2U2B974_9BACT|nr:DUF4834 family protein [Marinilabilia rubra]PWD99615.1 DUF4834 domain-containing protein [Marinilabilia rubra]